MRSFRMRCGRCMWRFSMRCRGCCRARSLNMRRGRGGTGLLRMLLLLYLLLTHLLLHLLSMLLLL